MTMGLEASERRFHRVALGDLTPANIQQLKVINSVVFPVTYNIKFYKEVLEVGEFAKLGMYKNCDRLLVV